MLSGLPYNPYDKQLLDERVKARTLLQSLNAGLSYSQKYAEIISQLLPNCPHGFIVQPPYFCDYGYNIYAGSGVFFNFDCTILDVCKVEIGKNVKFGPGVHIYTATHSKDPLKRRELLESGKPVSIGDDCWIGGRTVILPGVTVGNRCIVGAGAVVVKNVPNETTVAGNPAKPITHRQ